MTKNLSFVLNLLISAIFLLALQKAQANTPPTPPSQPYYNQNLLPMTFSVYTNGTVVINRSAPGFTKVLLPTDNTYTGVPGCYIACYSRSPNIPPGYTIGSGIYVHGQVRVPGTYQGRVCVPTGTALKDDISKNSTYNDKCNNSIWVPFCDSSCNECWAGGDTGGWYGLQP